MSLLFVVSLTHRLIIPVCVFLQKRILSLLFQPQRLLLSTLPPLSLSHLLPQVCGPGFSEALLLFLIAFSCRSCSEITINPFSSSLFCPDHLHQSQSPSHLPHNLHLQPHHPHHACCHSATSTCSGSSPHPDSDRRWNLPSPSSHWKHLIPSHSTGRTPDAPEAQLDASTLAEASCFVCRAFQ